MFTSIRGIYGVVGVMLFLIAMFLVLNNGTNATKIIGAFSTGGNNLARTLQGR